MARLPRSPSSIYLLFGSYTASGASQSIIPRLMQCWFNLRHVPERLFWANSGPAFLAATLHSNILALVDGLQGYSRLGACLSEITCTAFRPCARAPTFSDVPRGHWGLHATLPSCVASPPTASPPLDVVSAYVPRRLQGYDFWTAMVYLGWNRRLSSVERFRGSGQTALMDGEARPRGGDAGRVCEASRRR